MIIRVDSYCKATERFYLQDTDTYSIKVCNFSDILRYAQDLKVMEICYPDIKMYRSENSVVYNDRRYVFKLYNGTLSVNIDNNIPIFLCEFFSDLITDNFIESIDLLYCERIGKYVLARFSLYGNYIYATMVFSDGSFIGYYISGRYADKNSNYMLDKAKSSILMLYDGYLANRGNNAYV